jgi:hypothetical protein
MLLFFLSSEILSWSDVEFYQWLFLHLLQWSCDFSPWFFMCFIMWFEYFEPSLHLWNENNLLMVHDLFIALLNSVCKNFIKDFCIYVHHGNWSVVFFLIASLCGFGVMVALASQNEVRISPFLSILWK